MPPANVNVQVCVIVPVNDELADNVFGVVSSKPAYLMNAGLTEDALPVAVAGRVPVRVVGKVNKGDRLVSAGNGLARAAVSGEATSFNVSGRLVYYRLLHMPFINS